MVQSLQEDISRLLGGLHPSSKFPIDDCFKAKTRQWLERVTKLVKWKPNDQLMAQLQTDDTQANAAGEIKESEYVFKTYELVEG